VSYLLDSHAVLAAAFDGSQLSTKARAVIESKQDIVFVSAISPYELELKRSLGKMSFPAVADWDALIVRMQLDVLPISVLHGVTAARLPQHHKDPWDRVLVAQAMVESLTLVSCDRHIRQYAVATLW
jgi:PIN domain nuclease of toxin-antitoxin system